MDLELLKEEISSMLNEFLDVVCTKEVNSIVLGCSSSEVMGKSIGKNTNKDIGETIIKTFLEVLSSKNINLVVQGCEHINRALVVEKDYAVINNLEIVNVRPVLKAGGSCATAAFNMFKNPVMVEKVCVDAGIDIGDTFIGMHIKNVVIPLRLSINKIGYAHLSVASSRAKLIGGSRAEYQDNI